MVLKSGQRVRKEASLGGDGPLACLPGHRGRDEMVPVCWQEACPGSIGGWGQSCEGQGPAPRREFTRAALSPGGCKFHPVPRGEHLPRAQGSRQLLESSLQQQGGWAPREPAVGVFFLGFFGA